MTESGSRAAFRPADRHIRYTRYLAATLAVVVAGIHLFHGRQGFPRLVEILATGNAALLLTDPRPLLFVLSGGAILGGLLLLLWGAPESPSMSPGQC